MNDHRPPAFDYERLDWQENAACLWFDVNMFYPPAEHLAGRDPVDALMVVASKAVCATCSVRQECLDYALAIDERWGVWGGLTSAERRKLVRDAS